MMNKIKRLTEELQEEVEKRFGLKAHIDIYIHSDTRGRTFKLEQANRLIHDTIQDLGRDRQVMNLRYHGDNYSVGSGFRSQNVDVTLFFNPPAKGGQ